MTKSYFISRTKILLREIIDGRGKTLYSSINTLKKGNLYLMGYNPGGAEGHNLRDHLDHLDRQFDNEFDKEWGDEPGKHDPGEYPLQKRVKYLLENLGYKHTNVCASNLIFQGSPDQEGVDYPTLANLCWPVHQLIIEIIQPKVIIVFGNAFGKSPYAYIKMKHRKINNNEPVNLNENMPSKHGNWKIKWFKTSIFNFNHDVTIIGLPHLSRYDIKSPKRNNVIKKIKNIYDNAIEG